MIFVVFEPLFTVFSVISVLRENRLCPGFLAKFVVFANIRLFFEIFPPKQSAHSAEIFNVSVTELGVRGSL